VGQREDGGPCSPTLTRIPFDAQHLPGGGEPGLRVRRAAVAAASPPPPPMSEVGEERHGHSVRDRGAEGREDPRREAPAHAFEPSPSPSAAGEARRGKGREPGAQGPRKTPILRRRGPRRPCTSSTRSRPASCPGPPRVRRPSPEEARLGAESRPDDKTVVFARGHNLFMMDAENYKLALKDFGDPKVQEVQITTDGVEHYSFARRMNEQARTAAQEATRSGDNEAQGRPARARHRHAVGEGLVEVSRACGRTCGRWPTCGSSTRWPAHVPKLETYRYAMPGEENVDQAELLDLRSRDQGPGRREGRRVQGSDDPGRDYPVHRARSGRRRRPRVSG
jgi:hypothetical protein